MTQQICPVCKEPVGSKPHDQCLDERLAETETKENLDTFPCPACGQPMNDDMQCDNSDCENFAAK